MKMMSYCLTIPGHFRTRRFLSDMGTYYRYKDRIA